MPSQTGVPVNPIPEEILNGNRHQQSQPATPAPSPQKFSMIDNLLMFGHIQREFDMKGTRFVLRTLNNEEKTDAYASVAHLNPASIVHFSELRDQALKYAVVSVNGVSMESYFIPETEEDKKLMPHQRRLRFIKKMYPPVLEKLYDAYKTLEDEASSALADIKFDDVKNA